MLRGLIEVFKNYKVETFVDSSLDSSSQEYQALQVAVKASQAQIISPKKGTTISAGLIYLDILWSSLEYYRPRVLVMRKIFLVQVSQKRIKTRFLLWLN